MLKVDEYRKLWRGLRDWDTYLLTDSGLPGPRANRVLSCRILSVSMPSASFDERSIDHLPALSTD